MPGYSPLAPMVGTTPVVGPSTYFKKLKYPVTSKQPNAPAHAIPHSLRNFVGSNNGAIKETYED